MSVCQLYGHDNLSLKCVCFVKTKIYFALKANEKRREIYQLVAYYEPMFAQLSRVLGNININSDVTFSRTKKSIVDVCLSEDGFQQVIILLLKAGQDKLNF